MTGCSPRVNTNTWSLLSTATPAHSTYRHPSGSVPHPTTGSNFIAVLWICRRGASAPDGRPHTPTRGRFEFAVGAPPRPTVDHTRLRVVVLNLPSGRLRARRSTTHAYAWSF